MANITRLSAEEASIVLDQLVELLRDAVEGGASVGFVLPVETAELSAYWDNIVVEVRQNRRFLLAAWLDGRIVGSVQLEPAGKANAVHRAEVQKLLVHRSARRQGIGIALMRALETLALENRRSLLVLDTAGTQDAEPLYLKLGYQIAGRIPHYAISPDRSKIEATTFMYKLLDGV